MSAFLDCLKIQLWMSTDVYILVGQVFHFCNLSVGNTKCDRVFTLGYRVNVLMLAEVLLKWYIT